MLSSIAITTAIAQSQEFTDEATFVAALGSNPYTVEDYSTCPNLSVGADVILSNFTLAATIGNCPPGEEAYAWRGNLELNFNSPKNAFGTKIIDAGTAGTAITITLVTDDGASYTAVMSMGGDAIGNERFFGIISDMNFTMAIFDSDNADDGIYLDDTYCASTLESIPTLGEWGLIVLGIVLVILGVVAMERRQVWKMG